MIYYVPIPQAQLLDPEQIALGLVTMYHGQAVSKNHWIQIKHFADLEFRKLRNPATEVSLFRKISGIRLIPYAPYRKCRMYLEGQTFQNAEPDNFFAMVDFDIDNPTRGCSHLVLSLFPFGENDIPLLPMKSDEECPDMFYFFSFLKDFLANSVNKPLYIDDPELASKLDRYGFAKVVLGNKLGYIPAVSWNDVVETFKLRERAEFSSLTILSD